MSEEENTTQSSAPINTDESLLVDKTIETSSEPTTTEQSSKQTSERKHIPKEIQQETVNSEAEISSTREPLATGTDDILADNVNTVDEAVTPSLLLEVVTNISAANINATTDTSNNLEILTAENDITTVPVPHENTETMIKKSKKSLQTSTDAGLFETTLVKGTSQTDGVIELVSEFPASRTEKTFTTTLPLSSVERATSGLENSQNSDQTTRKATVPDQSWTSTAPNLEDVSTSYQTSNQGKSYKTFLDTVKNKQKSHPESYSKDNNTNAFTNITENANDQTVTDIPVDLEVVTNPLSVFSDTNSSSTSPSTAVTSILHVDSSAPSSSAPSIISAPDTDISELPVTKTSPVCLCDTQHASVPNLPSGFHIFPGTVV